MAADHRGHLAQELRRQGVGVEPGLLRSLRHDVVLGERLLARLTLGGGAG